METQPQIGKITIAPEVLKTVARLTTLAVPGVTRLTSPSGVRHLLQRGGGRLLKRDGGHLLKRDGVKIKVVEDRVQVELYVVTEPDTSMLGLSRQIQAEVTRAIQDMIGMKVQSVDVHIEDVAYSSGIA